jgi:DNA-binding XRE family transcriptional regulator
MSRNLDDIIKSLPAKRQTKIAALSKQKVEEMIAHAATLSDFRKAVGKTQVEVARELGIKQNAVSQLEKRSDTYVSTLRRFLKSLGMTLELSVVDKSDTRIDLPNFFALARCGFYS